MLNAKLKQHLKHVVLAGMVLLFPMLYVAGVSLGDATAAAIALGVGTIVAFFAILAY